jgi:hypothetical protein
MVKIQDVYLTFSQNAEIHDFEQAMKIVGKERVSYTKSDCRSILCVVSYTARIGASPKCSLSGKNC